MPSDMDVQGPQTICPLQYDTDHQVTNFLWKERETHIEFQYKYAH